MQPISMFLKVLLYLMCLSSVAKCELLWGRVSVFHLQILSSYAQWPGLASIRNPLLFVQIQMNKFRGREVRDLLVTPRDLWVGAVLSRLCIMPYSSLVKQRDFLCLVPNIPVIPGVY